MSDQQEIITRSIAARRLYDLGLLPIPCKAKDKPAVKWSELNRTSSIYTQSSFAAFDDTNNKFIAIVAGTSSNNVECLDFDLKYDTTGNLWNEFEAQLFDHDPHLARRLLIINTPSGGKHIIYRCETIGRNQKLAMRSLTSEELAKAAAEDTSKNQAVANRKSGRLVLIETRGQGGYFLTWPSEKYEFYQNTYASLEVITPDEREILLLLSRSFNQVSDLAKIKTKEEISKLEAQIFERSTIETAPGASGSLVKRGVYTLGPWEDYNNRGADKAIDLLIENGWKIIRTSPAPDDGRPVQYWMRPGHSDQDHSATFNFVPGRFFVFTTSSIFPHETPLSFFDIYTYLVAGGDKKKAIKNLELDGYGVRTTLDHSTLGLPVGKLSDSEAIGSDPNNIHRSKLDSTLAAAAAQIRTNEAPMANFNFVNQPVLGSTIATWWTTQVEQKRSGDFLIKKSINQHMFNQWLAKGGFRRYKFCGEYMFVRIDGHTVEEADRSNISEMVFKYIKSLPDRFDFITREELNELYVKNIDTMLSQNRLETLPLFNDEMVLRDTKDNSYVVFDNGVMITSKGGTYIENDLLSLNRFAWKHSIKSHRVADVVTEERMNRHPFSVFLFNVAGRDPERYNNLLRLIGYCIYNYKDPSVPAAVILCDSKISAKSQGGTGKGLLVKAMSYIRSAVYEDGKAFNRKNATEFRFGRVNHDTDLLHISDVTKSFDFEALFSIITEGFPVRKLYKAEEFIPYEKSPKVIISTNFSIAGEGSSHERRRVEFELSDHYNHKYTPFHDFNHHFFDGWGNEDWSIFYHLMARCVRLYMCDGMPVFRSINLSLRKFIDDTSADFTNWFFGFFGSKDDVPTKGPLFTGEILFDDIYNQYLSYASLERFETRPARFMKMIGSGASYLGIDISEISKQERIGLGFSNRRYLLVEDPYRMYRDEHNGIQAAPSLKIDPIQLEIDLNEADTETES